MQTKGAPRARNRSHLPALLEPAGGPRTPRTPSTGSARATTPRRVATTSPASCRGTPRSTTPACVPTVYPSAPATCATANSAPNGRPTTFTAEITSWCASCHTRYFANNNPNPDTADPLDTGASWQYPRPGGQPVQPPAPDRRGPRLPDLPRLPWLQCGHDRDVLGQLHVPQRRSVGLEPTAEGRQPRHLPGLPTTRRSPSRPGRSCLRAPSRPFPDPLTPVAAGDSVSRPPRPNPVPRTEPPPMRPWSDEMAARLTRAQAMRSVWV